MLCNDAAVMTATATLLLALSANALPSQCSLNLCRSVLIQSHFDIACKYGECFGCRWEAGGLSPESPTDFVSCESVDISGRIKTSSQSHGDGPGTGQAADLYYLHGTRPQPEPATFDVSGRREKQKAVPPPVIAVGKDDEFDYTLQDGNSVPSTNVEVADWLVALAGSMDPESARDALLVKAQELRGKPLQAATEKQIEVIGKLGRYATHLHEQRRKQVPKRLRDSRILGLETDLSGLTEEDEQKKQSTGTYK